jgi:cephalosporin-C deacetylase-like acetyl esterase
MTKVKEIKENLDRVKSINVLSSSEGGVLMVKSIRKEVLNSLDKLAYNYPTLSHTELLAECANLRARLEMLRLFNASKKNQTIAEEDLAEALKEELES